MGRWWWTVALSCLVLGAPAHAQLSGITGALDGTKPAAAGSDEEGAAPAPEGEATPADGDAEPPAEKPWVSQFCHLSFFTNESDTLDLRRSPGEPCFDTGRGSDVFKLDPENFPGGVRVFSDRGRSIIRLSDGPSLVFDQESTAEEIRTGRGDDTIRLGVGFVGNGIPVVTPETRVFPGGGNDLIVVGSGLGPALDGRHIANARVFPSAGVLSIEAGCGRMNDPDGLDTVVENAGSDVQVTASVRGCGLALRNHAAPTVVDQEGGRFVALLRPEGEEGRPGAFFAADIRSSSGLNFSALNPRSDTSLSWSGFGDATLQVEARLAESGGAYNVTADGTIFARVLAHGGGPVWDMESTKAIEFVVEGTATHSVRATMVAPAVVVEWRPQAAEAGPPVVSIGAPRDVEALRAPEASILEAVASSAASTQPGDPSEAPTGTENGVVVQATPSDPVQDGDAQATQETGQTQEEADAPGPTDAEAGGEASGEEAAPVAEVVVRDASGMTEAGRLAMLEGRPVERGDWVAPKSGRWSWKTLPTMVEVGVVEWRIVAAPDWCETIGVADGAVHPCGQVAVFRLDPGQKLGITRADGTRVWALATEHPVDVRWTPAL